MRDDNDNGQLMVCSLYHRLLFLPTKYSAGWRRQNSWYVDGHSIECASCCRICHSYVIWQHFFEDTPAIIAFDMSQHPISLLESIVITTVDGGCTAYKLRGIVYYLPVDHHFTLWFIAESGCVWYHDDIATGRQMVLEGTSVGDTELGTCRSGIVVCAVYAVISC
jgi:hypothetical protein